MSGFVMLGNGCGNTTRRAIWRCRAAAAWLGPKRERDGTTPTGPARRHRTGSHRRKRSGQSGLATPPTQRLANGPQPLTSQGRRHDQVRPDLWTTKGRRPKVNPRPPVRLPRKCSLLSDSQSIAAARVRAAHGARRFPGSPVPGDGVQSDRRRWPVGQPRSRPRIACPWHSGGWQPF